MAFYSSVVAADGLPLDLCMPGPRIPSSIEHVEYVNPRTRKTERSLVENAWSGDQKTPCDPRSTVAKIVRRF